MNEPSDLDIFHGWLLTAPQPVRLDPRWPSYGQALELARLGRCRFDVDENGDEYCVAVTGFAR